MKFDRIFLKFEKLPSNYITKLSTYARHKYEIFENFGAMLKYLHVLLSTYCFLFHEKVQSLHLLIHAIYKTNLHFAQ